MSSARVSERLFAGKNQVGLWYITNNWKNNTVAWRYKHRRGKQMLRPRLYFWGHGQMGHRQPRHFDRISHHLRKFRWRGRQTGYRGPKNGKKSLSGGCAISTEAAGNKITVCCCAIRPFTQKKSEKHSFRASNLAFVKTFAYISIIKVLNYEIPPISFAGSWNLSASPAVLFNC